LAKNYKKLRSFVAENKSIQNFQVDWKEWEAKLDKEAVGEVKKDADTVSQLYPRADTKKIVATINEYFAPLVCVLVFILYIFVFVEAGRNNSNMVLCQ